VNNFQIDLTDASDYLAAWLVNAVANSAHNGVKTNVGKADDLQAAVDELQEGPHATSDGTQDKINRLGQRMEMHDDQEVWFQARKDEAVSRWLEITGKKSWAPFSFGNVTPKDATATNKYIADRKKRKAAEKAA
jgi:hypothetical protein